MNARAEVLAQPFIQTDLQRMIDGLGAVAAQSLDAARVRSTLRGRLRQRRRRAVQERRISAICASLDDWIAVDSLEKAVALRANIADAQDDVLREFARNFQAELISGW